MNSTTKFQDFVSMLFTLIEVREVLPLRKGGGGAEKVLAMLKGGHKKFWGRFYAVA